MQYFHLLSLLPPTLPGSETIIGPHRALCQVPGIMLQALPRRGVLTSPHCMDEDTESCKCLKLSQGHRDEKQHFQALNQVQPNSRIPGVCHFRQQVKFSTLGLVVAWGSPNYRQVTLDVTQSLCRCTWQTKLQRISMIP